MNYKDKNLIMRKLFLICLCSIFSFANAEQSFYDFEAKSLDHKKIKMSDYKGKVVLVVNTASECGLTPQYEGLQKLHDKYASKGLVILGFPCNQFGGQEPGSEEDIAKGCVLNYGVKFQMFEKVDVNGNKAHPIFKFLKSKQSGLITDAIKWNFTKFLIDKKGKPVDRYAPTTKPKSLEKDIEKYLLNR
jgi:glutathione peroxidase